MKRYCKAAVVGILTVIMISGCSSTAGNTGMTVRQSEAREASIKTLETEQKPEFTKEQIRRLQVVEGGNVRYELNYRPKEDRESYLYWEMSVPYKTIATVDTEAMYNLYSVIAGIDLTKPKQSKKDENVAKTKTSITISYAKNEDAKLADKMFTLLIGDKTNENQYCCALKGFEDQVFFIDAFSIDAILNKKPYDMILKVPYLVNVTSVEKVDITYGGNTHNMSLQQDVYAIDGKTVKQKEYCNLYSKLMELMITGEVPAATKLKKNRAPELMLQYKRKQQGAEGYTVKVFPYDAKNDSIQVNGEEFFLVDKEDTKTLISTLNQYF